MRPARKADSAKNALSCHLDASATQTVYTLTVHFWKVVRLGRVTPEGQFDIVWSSDAPVRPEPFPTTRSRAEWEAFLAELYRGWGNRSEAPAAT